MTFIEMQEEHISKFLFDSLIDEGTRKMAEMVQRRI